jgi:hypothetical protein
MPCLPLAVQPPPSLVAAARFLAFDGGLQERRRPIIGIGRVLLWSGGRLWIGRRMFGMAPAMLVQR